MKLLTPIVARIKKRSPMELYQERMQDCRYCGTCKPCRDYTYHSYQEELRAQSNPETGKVSLNYLKERWQMHEKYTVVEQDRARAARDLLREAEEWSSTSAHKNS